MAEWENNVFNSGWTIGNIKQCLNDEIDYGINNSFFWAALRVESTTVTSTTVGLKLTCDVAFSKQSSGGTPWGYYRGQPSANKSKAGLYKNNVALPNLGDLYDGNIMTTGSNTTYSASNPPTSSNFVSPSASTEHGYKVVNITVNKSELPITLSYKVKVGNHWLSGDENYSIATVTVPIPTVRAIAVSNNTVMGNAGVSTSENGTYTPYVDVVPGTTVWFKATPNTGYYFNNWTGDRRSTQNPYEVMVESGMTLTANFVDFYVVSWTCNIPDKFEVNAQPSHSAGRNDGQFNPGEVVQFSFRPKLSSIKNIPLQNNILYKDDSNYYILNKWAWVDGSDIGTTDSVSVEINNGGVIEAFLNTGDLVTYTLQTNYVGAYINNNKATTTKNAIVKIAPGYETIHLKAITDNPNFTFWCWIDVDTGDVISFDAECEFPTSGAGALNSYNIKSIYDINGEDFDILATDNIELIAQPIYIKNGALKEVNTRFMNWKYPDDVDWAKVKKNTGFEPKIGDLYFMVIKEEEDIK